MTTNSETSHFHTRFDKSKLRIDLSYRTRDKDSRELLVNGCRGEDPDNRSGPELIFDEKDIKDGESITQFMEDLSGAKSRFVMILLTRDYFQSAYTLHELLLMQRYLKGNPNCLERMIVHADDQLTQHWYKDLVKFWEPKLDEGGYFAPDPLSDHQITELIRLRHLPEKYDKNTATLQDRQAMWEEINRVWHELIIPYLDTRQTSIFAITDDKNFVDKLVARCQLLFDAEVKQLRDKVLRELRRIFGLDVNTAMQLIEKFPEDYKGATAEQLAKALVDNPKGAEHSLYQLQEWLGENSYRQSLNPDDWKKQLKNVLDICSWLVLLTIDPYWWVHKQLVMMRALQEQEGVVIDVNCKNIAYAEVVMARALFRMPSFRLDGGKLVPGSHNIRHDVFDRFAEKSAHEMLLEVYKDVGQLSESDQYPEKDDLLGEIVTAMVSNLEPQNEKDILNYVVTQKKWGKIQKMTWLDQKLLDAFEQEFKEQGYLNRLRFVHIANNPEDQKICLYNEKIVIKRIETIAKAFHQKQNG